MTNSITKQEREQVVKELVAFEEIKPLEWRSLNQKEHKQYLKLEDIICDFRMKSPQRLAAYEAALREAEEEIVELKGRAL